MDWIEQSRELMGRNRVIRKDLVSIFNKLVNVHGEVVDAQDIESPGLSDFLELLYSQANTERRMLDERFNREILQKFDLEHVGKFLSMAELGKSIPSKYKKLDSHIRALWSSLQSRINILFLISPHTFCQTESPIDADVINDVIDDLAHPSHYGSYSGGWIQTRWIDVPNNDGLRTIVKGYLHTEKNSFRVKTISTNSLGDLEDKLDVESLFHGDEFIGVVHYHVEKPATIKLLVDDSEGMARFTQLHKMELTRNPDNKAMLLDLGSGKKRTHRDMLKSYGAGTFEVWKARPYLVGGHVVNQLITAIKENGAFRYLHQRAVA